jgi:hypothetical protein
VLHGLQFAYKLREKRLECNKLSCCLNSIQIRSYSLLHMFLLQTKHFYSQTKTPKQDFVYKGWQKTIKQKSKDHMANWSISITKVMYAILFTTHGWWSLRHICWCEILQDKSCSKMKIRNIFSQRRIAVWQRDLV